MIEGGYARGYHKPIVRIFRISVLGTDSTAVHWRTGEGTKNCFEVWSHSLCFFKFFYQVGIYSSWLNSFFFIKFLSSRDVGFLALIMWTCMV